jgi:hypothetical protein
MSAIHEQFLTVAELDELIRKLEEKYGRTTLDFLRDPEFRATVSEDDYFQWEAFVSHKAALDELEQDVRRQYLQQVSQAPASAEPDAGEKQVLLAA